MAKRSGVVLSVVALAVLLPGSAAYADHASSKRTHDQGAAEKVKGRLVQLGVAPAEADRQVGSLTSKDLSYFAADPGSRVQVVAGMWGEEWLLGLGFIALLAIAYAWRIGFGG